MIIPFSFLFLSLFVLARRQVLIHCITKSKKCQFGLFIFHFPFSIFHFPFSIFHFPFFIHQFSLGDRRESIQSVREWAGIWEEGIEYQNLSLILFGLEPKTAYDSPLRIKFYLPVLRQSFAYANRKSLQSDSQARLNIT